MEIWKDITNYEGLYQISNYGNVKSLNYRRTGIPKILTPKRNNCGRLWVELRNGKSAKPLLIHRLVATEFIPNPNNYPEINHIDENPANNNVSNLEWCTHKYNVNCYLQRHSSSDRRISIFANKRNSKMKMAVEQYTKTGEYITTWNNSCEVAKKYGWSNWSISECCRGNRKTAYGYIWRYASEISV